MRFYEKKSLTTSITTLSLTKAMVEHETDDIQPSPSKLKDHGTDIIYDWEYNTPSFDFKVDHKTQYIDDLDWSWEGKVHVS